MDTSAWLKEVEEEIERLQGLAKQLRGGKATRGRKKRKPMSAAARKKISAAQHARWDKVHKAKKSE